MPYSGTATVTKKTIAGRDYYIVAITETEGAAASEATISGVPIVGRILDVTSTKTAGDATTVDPEIGRAATWTDLTQDEVWQNGVAAAHIDAQPGKAYYSATGTLYWRASPSSGTNNSISSQILIAAGGES
jgi:hypothetical protein